MVPGTLSRNHPTHCWCCPRDCMARALVQHHEALLVQLPLTLAYNKDTFQCAQLQSAVRNAITKYSTPLNIAHTSSIYHAHPRLKVDLGLPPVECMWSSCRYHSSCCVSGCRRTARHLGGLSVVWGLQAVKKTLFVLFLSLSQKVSLAR